MIRVLLVIMMACGLFAQTQDLLEQADEAFRRGDLPQASKLAQQVLDREPAALHAHMILGVIAAQNSQWDATTRHFQAVVKLEPSNPIGYFYLGQAKLYQRQWEAAIAFFKDALKREYPEPDRLLVELALAQNETGRATESLASLAKCSQPIDPHLAAQYYAVLAATQLSLNKYAPAIEAARLALQSDDSIPHTWAILIDSLIRTDEVAHALAEAIRAQRKFPDDADIQFLFALASYHVTQSPLGRLALRNLKEADPASPRVLLAEGLALRKEGRNDEALAAFKQAAARDVPDAHLLLGILLREAGDQAGAEKEYREAEKHNPNNGQVLLEMAKILIARGDLAGALTRLKKAVELMPSDPPVHYQLGIVHRRLGQTEEAEKHFNRFRQLQAESGAKPAGQPGPP